MADALTLADFRAELTRVACRRCDWRGQYRRTALIARYGEEAPLPDVLAQLAHDCPMRSTIGNEACGAYFPDPIERPPAAPLRVRLPAVTGGPKIAQMRFAVGIAITPCASQSRRTIRPRLGS